MPLFFADFGHLISAYGAWVVAGLIALECIGIPLPGEAILIAAAIYAGTTHELSIVAVIAAAIIGAILGNTIGYWLGREIGCPLLMRYGRYLRLTESRFKIGQYMFMRYGSLVVLFARFVAVLRSAAAILAGVNRMPWRDFMLANVVGGIAWVLLYGLAAYYLGQQSLQLARPVAISLGAVAVVAVAVAIILLLRNEKRLAAEAERVLPGRLQ